ncbi:hypothetical protein BV25DRAFT_1949700 [Artomyces pyxidatus]|uniref:Uncharacterized protein n=1 Tax=Artomyces pyxidatus TaxID=48021 RepID=A0ACB8SDI2_9AGAM|nr:hypothetical protein BV25DRAFT_1949700 [Artomyces pyxidatus]
MLNLLHSARQSVREPWSLQRLVRERAVALGSAIDPSTRLSYTSHLQSYLTFCKIHHRSVEPTVDTITFYIVFMSHHIQPRSVRTYLSGICNQLEHVYPNVRDIRKHPMVVRTLTGCMKLYSSPPTRKEPLTIEHLAHVLNSISNPTHNDLLFRAIIFSGFFALHRLGELTDHDRIELRSSRKTIMRATVTMQPRTYSYVLPGHKADPTFYASEGWPDDRIQALGRWSSDAFRIYIRKSPILLQALLHSRVRNNATPSAA